MWTEPILHVDMDSFFVEVERLDRPELRHQPVAVGGAGRRGVIASASYEARSFGVRSAQPTSMARRVCPTLTVVPPRHGRYSEVSATVFDIFRDFTPLVEGLSLDEAFLDVGGLHRHYPSSVEVAEKVRDKLRSELGLPASVGVASVKFIAKLASERAKPDGILHVPAEGQVMFLQRLPATAMWGVGPATGAALARLGVETVGDIAAVPLDTLVGAVGPAAGRSLHDLANGRDPRPVVADISAKSISVEETYEVDLTGRDVLETALLAHAQRLSGRLRRADVLARTITLKVRYGDFTTLNKATTLASPTRGARQLSTAATEMLASLDVDRPVRLLGLGASALQPAEGPVQLDLGTDADWDQIEAAVALVRDRFGDQAVNPARLAGGRRSVDGPQEHM